VCGLGEADGHYWCESGLSEVALVQIGGNHSDFRSEMDRAMGLQILLRALACPPGTASHYEPMQLRRRSRRR
jgi:hypothetical protein